MAGNAEKKPQFLVQNYVPVFTQPACRLSLRGWGYTLGKEEMSRFAKRAEGGMGRLGRDHSPHSPLRPVCTAAHFFFAQTRKESLQAGQAMFT